MVSGSHPYVRTVVVNYNGGAMTRRCLDALLKTEWPSDRHQIVLVDNASTDGLVDEVRLDLPQVDVIEAGANVGFGGACNLAMRDLRGVDYVALVNNDAFVDPAWLSPLVDALEADRWLGAACPKILFEPRFVDLHIETATFVPEGLDHRSLGVRVSGVEVDGRDVWRAAQLVDGFWGLERGGEDGEFQWTFDRARLRVPLPGEGPVPDRCRIRLGAERVKQVRLVSGAAATTIDVRPGAAWYDVSLEGQPYDVVNNAGSKLVRGGWGADRGYLQRDDGQFEEPAEVFAWCGAGVVLSAQFLSEVGLFDDHFFLYYEDTDLSWRGRLAGWRYRYVPGSVIRHVHSATSVEGSPVFRHFVDRNRLLMLARNAPVRLVASAVWAFLVETARLWWRDVGRPRRHGGHVDPALVAQRSRSFLAFVKALPATLLDRLRRAPSRRVGVGEVATWMVD